MQPWVLLASAGGATLAFRFLLRRLRPRCLFGLDFLLLLDDLRLRLRFSLLLRLFVDIIWFIPVSYPHLTLPTSDLD